jgi:NAD(P)-dependent dehydrogenase (short-subunit alcohol dehydrogenase family)
VAVGRRGNGSAIALTLAESGFDIVLCDIERAEATLKDLLDRGAKANFVVADPADPTTHGGLAEHGIAAFEIQPSFILTEMLAPFNDRFTAMIESGATPIRRWGQPADVDTTVASLATGALAYSVGQPIHVDGALPVHRL